jgi:hypothetical protein
MVNKKGVKSMYDILLAKMYSGKEINNDTVIRYVTFKEQKRLRYISKKNAELALELKIDLLINKLSKEHKSKLVIEDSLIRTIVNHYCGTIFREAKVEGLLTYYILDISNTIMEKYEKAGYDTKVISENNELENAPYSIEIAW